MSVFRVIAVFVGVQVVVVGAVFTFIALGRAYGEDPYVVGPYKTAAYAGLALTFVLDGLLVAWSIRRGCQRRREQEIGG